MKRTKTLWCSMAMSCLLCVSAQANETVPVKRYAQELLSKAGRAGVTFRVVENLGHAEAFRINAQKHGMVVDYQSPAGALYGAQAILADEVKPGAIEKPDLDIRGTTLPLMHGGGYVSTLSPETFPWFFDKALMTQTLDALADARINAIFLWAGHIFPYIVEMPKYPEASADVPPEQVKNNQEQFRWFTNECAKRNIQVLLHFYNIHVSPPFARHHRMRTNPTTPTPLLREYTHYALSRYFEAFPHVGLYACPGESIHSRYQLEWFRDVVFQAAKDSGKNPVIVIRDWTLNMDFQQQLKSLYGNVYSELKHHDESVTSPYPDVRHLKWEGLTHGHIINAAHGPAEDLAPMRWASPVYVQEKARHWQSLGFVKGSEFWLQSFWRWPYTFDRLNESESGSVKDGSNRDRLLYLDRDAPFIKLIGRAMWKADRDPGADEAYWNRYQAARWGSDEIGRLMTQWYTVSGPISPGLQNLNATRVANFYATLLLMNQFMDQILEFNESLAQTPYTLYRETGRAGQRTYPRPYDGYFFERYRREYGLPKPGATVAMYEEFAEFADRMGIENLAQRHVLPVTQYARLLESGEEVDIAMTPDRVVRLLNTLAQEALATAEKMVSLCIDPKKKPELQRYVTDSRMYELATRVMIHKQDAAILKARMLASDNYEHMDAFLREMEKSVKVYEQLAEVADAAYLFANGYRMYRWGQHGLPRFRKDLEAQRSWALKVAGSVVGGEERINRSEDLITGGIRIEAEWMSGPWKRLMSKYSGFQGSGYAASLYAHGAAKPEPLSARIKVENPGVYIVSIRALLGGDHQDRALAVEVNGNRLKTTHQGEGPPSGEWTWDDAGTVELTTGVNEIKVYPVGKGHPAADVILLMPADD